MKVGLADEVGQGGEGDDAGSDLAKHERAHVAFVFRHDVAFLNVTALKLNIIKLLDALNIRG